MFCILKIHIKLIKCVRSSASARSMIFLFFLEIPKNPDFWDFSSFPNSEILFDFNEGSSGVFKDHLML